MQMILNIFLRKKNIDFKQEHARKIIGVWTTGLLFHNENMLKTWD